MRTPVPLLAALVLAACGSSDRRDSSAERGASPSASRGPDPIVLRVPRDGGRVSAYLYPNLDSAVWRSGEEAPALARVLAFDVEGGRVAAVDTRGIPTRIDLRLGQVRAASKRPLEGLASGDGVAIFGVADGRVTRLTPSGGDWTVRLPAAPEALYPQRDGSLLVAANRGGRGVVWQLRPPTARASDSVSLAAAGRPVGAATGDRVYFTVGAELVGVRARDLELVQPVVLDAPVRAVVATPSGDRLYVATSGTNALAVVDRYADRVAGAVPLPGAPRELRVDPLGRYVLARAATGDSAWVVAVGSDELVGTVATSWRADLPLVLPDGAIATATGDDVAVLVGPPFSERQRVAGGARDFWHVVLWNGFRPRAAGLDRPVEFETAAPARDSASADSVPADSAPVDSAADTDSARVPTDTTPPQVSEGTVAIRVARSVRTAPHPSADVARPQPGRRRYTVQFAAEASERDARTALRRIRIDGVTLRIVPATRDGRQIWRVVAGPYPTRAEAERVGRTSGHDYWVYEGAP